MESKNYTVQEFIRMTPPQKVRLMQRDPNQYKVLLDCMNQMFPTEEIAINPSDVELK